jgi:Leucine-rich repeat (LRR) protein
MKAFYILILMTVIGLTFYAFQFLAVSEQEKLGTTPPNELIIPSLHPKISAVTFPIPKRFCQKVTEIPTAQCQTLLALYNSTNGKDWEETPFNQWGVTNTPCQWWGITCQKGKVIAINLRYQRLKGQLPDLSALHSLQRLDLSSNQLTGSLPDLSRLSHLQQFDFSGNQFNMTFSIPKTYCQRVTDIPSTQCQTLVALYNKTNGKDWKNIPRGTETNTPCQWWGIRCEGGNVVAVDLAENNLRGDFPELTALTNLRTLDLSVNQLSGSVPDLSRLVSLARFNLAGNQLILNKPFETFCQKVKQIPTTECQALVDLYHQANGKDWADALQNNWGLTNTPCRWQGIECREGHVISIERSYKDLKGVMPDSSRLTHLKKVYLDEPPLDGHQAKPTFPIPKSFCQKVRTIPQLECQALVDFYNLTDGKYWETTPANNWGITNTPCQWEGIKCQDGNVISISLYSKGLQGVIPDLSRLTRLKALKIYHKHKLKITFPIYNGFCQKVTEIPKHECQALVTLYNQTTGKDWKDTPENLWGLTSTPCKWEGVKCEKGHVVSIERFNNGLKGLIPDLSLLTRLEKLKLYDKNALNVAFPIPNDFCQKVTELPKAECQTLVALYNQTNGKDWKDTPENNWGITRPCLWEGVKCQQGNVISIKRFYKGLKGVIPDFSRLARLEALNLYYGNELNVTFPVPKGFCQNVTEIPRSECQTLVEFYNQTNGKDWKDTPQNNWGVVARPCSWKGVKCQLGHVVSIKRFVDGLNGFIPDLSQLTHLEKLKFYYKNELKVSFPISNRVCQNVTEIPTTQCQALIDFYNSTNGKDWIDTPSNNWGLSKMPCQWKGVDCRNGNVIAIKQSFNGLKGIVPDLSRLTHLENLDLLGNQLKASFPISKTFCQTVTEIPTNQCQTLIDFYNSTNGKGWEDTPTNKWGLTKTPCQWQGIACKDGNVISIKRFIDGLNGFIPDLSRLTHLEKLDLFYKNELKASFPISNTFCQTVTEIPKTQCQALVDIYNQTNGIDWKDTPSNNWGLTKMPCQWQGVTCRDGNVISIKRFNVGLTGILPDLSRLTHLEQLYLFKNQLSGFLQNLTGLTHLKVLSLSANKLSGSIPDLSRLTRLEELYLYQNQLSGSLPNLSALINLKHLNLSKNKLSGSIPDLSQLINLKHLNLSKNKLSGSIPDLNPLIQLEALALGENKLTGAIPDLDALTQLKKVYLYKNQLTGSIPELSQLIHLEELALADNQLSGSIPALSTLTQLKKLYLYNNKLTGSIPELSQLIQLEELALAENQLSGSIPELSALTQLKKLYLYKNLLSGTLPDLSALSNLKILSLYNNQLSGAIPNLSALGNLKILSLYNNQLTGSIPKLSQLIHLEDLALAENQLSGSIPELSTLTRLKKLSLYKNQLSGTLPYLSALSNLKILSLHTNKLSGAIPNLSALSNLKILNLSINQLTGSIPELSQLVQLEELALAENQLSGSIPGLSALTQLKKLYLYKNQLSGTLPDLSALSHLKILSLSNNKLSGSIPDLSRLTRLEGLYLYNNQLSGSIPELSALTQLKIIHLHKNQLTGSIPKLSQLIHLEELALAENQLIGSIPELTALTQLKKLYLYKNQLSGTLPDLSALSHLKILSLYNNQLSGAILNLSALGNLKVLSLYNNQLSGAIPNLNQLIQSEAIDLSNNKLDGVLPNLTALTKLKYLNFTNNNLKGAIPDKLGDCVKRKPLFCKK